MPRCYFLSVCAGSSVDQHSNNVTLFNLVERITVPPGAPPPPKGIIPLEVHAYFDLAPDELGSSFELRFVMLAPSGLETPSDAFTHKPVTPRYRTRTLGLPFPPVVGNYSLCVDTRTAGVLSYQRQELSWPVTIAEADRRPGHCSNRQRLHRMAPSIVLADPNPFADKVITVVRILGQSVTRVLGHLLRAFCRLANGVARRFGYTRGGVA